MARLYLRTKDKKYPKGDWELVLGKNRVRLTDPEGYVEADFAREDADRRFQLPSFWASVKTLGVNTDDKKVIWFVRDKEAEAEVRRYLDYALAAQGGSAIAARRWKGWAMVLSGIVVMMIGVAILIYGISQIGRVQGRNHGITGGIFGLVFGGALIGGGITSLSRARRAESEWGAEEE
jgi:hypothetical protein